MAGGRGRGKGKVEEEMAGGRAEVIPSFFKVFLPDVSSHRLSIPLAFSHHIKGKLPKRGFLRERGNVWPVGLIKVDDKFFFNNGWATFVEDHHIQLGEILFFQFDGQKFFDFKLLGLNYCKKPIASPFSFKIKQEEEEFDGEHTEEEEEEEENGDDDDDLFEPDQQEQSHEAAEEEEVTCTKALKTEAGSSRKRSIINEAAVFRSGRIARPKNPYFFTSLNQKRKDLKIPSYVINDFEMKLPDKMTICDDEGRSWSSKVVKWRDGRVILTTGWKKFCRWNHLEEENLCLCEFSSDLSGLFLRIQILQLDGESWSPRPTN